MHIGKTLFAQVMEFVPWTSFARIVQRYGGNSGVRTLTCAEQFRAMAFAQLTWRESLRDIEASLSANASKLYGMGFRSAVKRSTLADANESRDWRIWSDLAALLIRRARKLYANDSLGVDLDNTVYALDSSTIDLCLSLFEWAPFRSTKAAIKLHTLLDLRGAIPAFIHISDGKLHDVNVLDLLALRTRRVLRDAIVAMWTSQGCTPCIRPAPSSSRAPSRQWMRGACYSAATDRSTGVISDQRVMLNGHYSAKKYPEHLRRVRFKDPASGKTLVFLTNNTALPALTIAALYKSRWQVELFFKWNQAAPAHQEVSRQQRERREDAGVVRSGHLRAHRYRQEGASTRCLALHMSTDLVGLGIRENRGFMRPAGRYIPDRPARRR